MTWNRTEYRARPEIRALIRQQDSAAQNRRRAKPDALAKIQASARARYAKNKTSIRDKAFTKRYGISFQDAANLLWAQGGECANEGCRKTLEFPSKYAHLDHDHITGKIRGVICYHCNLALGFAKDSKKVLLGLVNYLEK